MTTTTTDNDGKQLGHYLKEKLTIAATRFSDDEMTRAVTKVTSHALKIPNVKHMERLLNATYGQFNSGGNDYGQNINKWIVDELASHLHAHSWIIVLKTALAYHRLMCDGSDGFNIAVQDKRGLFSLSHLKDLADSPEGAEQQVFITHYLRYLEERQVAQAANHIRMKGLRIENRGFEAQLQKLSGREATATTSAILLQFETAIDVQFIPHAVNNFATLQGHKNVLVDAKALFLAISRRMVSILDEMENASCTAEDREAWLPIYKRYAIASKRFAQKLKDMSESRVAWGEPLPQIRPLPEDALEQLSMALDPRHGTRHSVAASAAAAASSGGAMQTVKMADLQANNNNSGGALPTIKLADLLAAQKVHEGRVSPVEGRPVMGAAAAAASSGVPVATVIKPANPQPTGPSLSDIFSPKQGANAATAAAGLPPVVTVPATGAGIPDLFAQAPTRPAPVAGAGINLFGGGGATNTATSNVNDIFGPAPASTNNNSHNSAPRGYAGGDIFGGPPSAAAAAAAPVIAHSNAAPTIARVPLDPFATITATTPIITTPQQQQQHSATTPAGAGFTDFFAQPAAGGSAGANSNNARPVVQPAFDPFAPSDPSGRSKAW